MEEQVELFGDGELGLTDAVGVAVGQFATDNEQAGTEVAGDVGIDFGEEIGVAHQTAVEA